VALTAEDKIDRSAQVQAALEAARWTTFTFRWPLLLLCHRLDLPFNAERSSDSHRLQRIMESL
jgi:hypothetical protein